MRVRRIRFVHLLTALVCFAMLTTSAVQVYSAYAVGHDLLHDTALRLNQESAQQMSLTMSTIFKSMKNGLQATAEHLAKQMPAEIAQGDGAAGGYQEHLDAYFASNRLFNSVFIVNDTATVKAVAPATVGLIGTKLLTEESLRALQTRRPTMSSPYLSVTDRLIVLLTHPMYSASGAYLGYVAGTIYLQDSNAMNDIFDSTQTTMTGSYSFVVDAAGRLLFHPDRGRVGDDVSSNAVVWELMQGQTSYAEVFNTAGIAHLAGYALVPQTGWGIVVQTPVAAVDREGYALLRAGLLYSVPVFLFILTITIIVAVRLAAPFSELAQTAKRLTDGERVADLSDRVYWTFEAHQLSKTMMMAMDKLQRTADQFLTEAQTDSLTGLANRRTINVWMEAQIDAGSPFAVVSLDIDHFKQINDTLGHPVGDQVLCHVANLILAEAGADAHSCRLGGEEFIILLPGKTSVDAFLAAEQLRLRIQSEVSPAGTPITVSLGVAAHPSHAMNGHDVLCCVDQALYAAKRTGRNRTTVYEPAT